MASEAVLDFESLLAPISAEQPGGAELRESPELSDLYYRIKDTRDASRASERQLFHARLYGDEAEVSRIDPPAWAKVKQLALEVLANKSKDLWIAAWLIEALVRLDGFPGLRDGFRLTRELVERYWEDIHPRPDEDGYVHTVSQLAGLNGDEAEGALIGPIESVPITLGTTRDPLTSRDYKDALEFETITDPARREQRLAEGAVTLQMFDRAVAETPLEFFLDLREDIQQCLDEFRRLDEALEPRCGKDEDGYPVAPPTSNILRTLDECLDRVKSLTRNLPGVAETAEAGVGASEVGESAAGASRQATVSTGPVASREDAFRALLQIADYFRRTEPHSPVSYALEQAVRWGKMTLPELMAELISEQATREDLFRRVGIVPREFSDDA